MLEIIERFERLEVRSDRYQIASEEILVSIKFLEEKKDSQLFIDRMLLTNSGIKGTIVDEYNTIGCRAQCLVPAEKSQYLKILRSEFNEN